MSDTKALLHEIQNPDLSPSERARLRCRLAKQLEQTGNYDAARDALGDLWQGFGESPNVEGLDTWTTGEVFLRTGTITAWIGSVRAVEGSQETAKNFISESIAFFHSLGDTVKIAEAQAEIALTYERQGALDEARVFFTQALAKLDDATGDVKATVVLRAAVLEAIANRLSDALAILRSGVHLFEVSENHTLKGSFHNELAIVQKRLGTLEAR